MKIKLLVLTHSDAHLRITRDEKTVIVANFLRGNTTRYTAHILQRPHNSIGNVLRSLGYYRNTKARGKKQTQEHIAKRVKNWGRKKKAPVGEGNVGFTTCS